MINSPFVLALYLKLERAPGAGARLLQARQNAVCSLRNTHFCFSSDLGGKSLSWRQLNMTEKILSCFENSENTLHFQQKSRLLKVGNCHHMIKEQRLLKSVTF